MQGLHAPEFVSSQTVLAGSSDFKQLLSHGQPSSRGTEWKKFESQRSRGSQKREICKIARGVDSLGLHSPAAQRPMSGPMLSHAFRVGGKEVEGAHGPSLLPAMIEISAVEMRSG